MNTNDYAEKVNKPLNDDKLLLQDNRQKSEPIIVQQKPLNKLLLQIKDQPASHDSGK